MTDQQTSTVTDSEPAIERRRQPDRRSGKDRRGDIRYEHDRRQGHGRRKTDKDPWKDAFHD